MSESAALHRRVWEAVQDGLTDCGDGSYVTSFDTDEDANLVADKVTLRVLDALGLEQVGWHADNPSRYCPAHLDLAVFVKNGDDYAPVYRLNGCSDG